MHVSTTIRNSTPGQRDIREVIRDEQFMRARILKVLESGPQTIPEIDTRSATAPARRRISG